MYPATGPTPIYLTVGRSRFAYPEIDSNAVITNNIPQNDGSIIYNYSDGVTKREYLDRTQHLDFPGGITQTRYPDHQITTNYNDGMKQTVYPNGDVIYDREGQPFKVKYKPYQGGRFQSELIEKKPNGRLKVFFPNGGVSTYIDDIQQNIKAGVENVERDLLPDGTEIKFFRNERILVRRNRNIMEKIAGYRDSVGEFIPLIRKDLRTGYRQILVNPQGTFSDVTKALARSLMFLIERRPFP